MREKQAASSLLVKGKEDSKEGLMEAGSILDWLLLLSQKWGKQERSGTSCHHRARAVRHLYIPVTEENTKAGIGHYGDGGHH